MGWTSKFLDIMETLKVDAADIRESFKEPKN